MDQWTNERTHFLREMRCIDKVYQILNHLSGNATFWLYLMGSCISIRGCVCLSIHPAVHWSIRPSHTSRKRAESPFLTKIAIDKGLKQEKMTIRGTCW